MSLASIGSSSTGGLKCFTNTAFKSRNSAFHFTALPPLASAFAACFWHRSSAMIFVFFLQYCRMLSYLHVRITAVVCVLVVWSRAVVVGMSRLVLEHSLSSAASRFSFLHVFAFSAAWFKSCSSSWLLIIASCRSISLISIGCLCNALQKMLAAMLQELCFGRLAVKTASVKIPGHASDTAALCMVLVTSSCFHPLSLSRKVTGM